MPDRPSDVRKKLDELYMRTEDIRQNLIEVHNMLLGCGFFDPPKEQYQQQPVFVPPVVQEQYVPSVPPPVQEVVEPVVPVANQPEVVNSGHYHSTSWNQNREPGTGSREPKPGFFERNPDLEKFIGERLVTFIGIAILVTGIAFFVKYAIDRDWINEIGRTAIGILCGGVLIGFAHRLRKSYTTFSSVLAGGGISVLYFTISYAFQVYHLFPQPVALGLLIVVTGFTVLLSVAYNRKELAILAIAGGFASPLMIKTGEGNFVVLCTYMLVLDAGMLVLAYYKKWNIITILAFVFTILFYSISLQNDIRVNQHAHDHEAFVFATLFYLVFFSMNIINNLKARRKFASFEIISLLTNTGLYYGAGYFLLQHMGQSQMNGLFTLVVAAFNLVFAYGLFKRQEVDRNLVYFLVGIVITFVSLAGPVQLEGNHITLFWAAEAALLLWFFFKSRLTIVKYFSMILNAVLVLSVLYNWMNVYLISGKDLTLFVNKGFITTLGGVISLVVSSVLLIRSKEEFITGEARTESYRRMLSVAAMCMLFMGGFFELSRQLTMAGYDKHGMAVFNSAYIVLFVVAAWYALEYLRMEFFRWTLRVAVVGLLVLSVVVPHFAIVDVRDAWLQGTEHAFGAFMFHYIYSGALLLIGSIVLRDAFSLKETSEQFRNFYLWLFSAVTIFILSAELDHAMVMSYSYNPENPLWRADMVNQTISKGLGMSHKVGFPIIWGICSFVMMAIGMQKKNRQIRIISLALFSLTIVKLVLLGIYGESQAGKIIAFILCGVILLLVSFMYQRLKKLIMDDHKPESDLPNENMA